MSKRKRAKVYKKHLALKESRLERNLRDYGGFNQGSATVIQSQS